MSFLDKVKKGLGTAVDGAKIASSMAIMKKDLEHAKLKKSKALKQLGEIVYNNKEEFATEVAFSELLGEIETLDLVIVKLEEDLSEEGKKFNAEEAEVSEVEEVTEKKEVTEETVVTVKKELMDQEKE